MVERLPSNFVYAIKCFYIYSASGLPNMLLIYSYEYNIVSSLTLS